MARSLDVTKTAKTFYPKSTHAIYIFLPLLLLLLIEAPIQVLSPYWGLCCELQPNPCFTVLDPCEALEYLLLRRTVYL